MKERAAACRVHRGDAVHLSRTSPGGQELWSTSRRAIRSSRSRCFGQTKPIDVSSLVSEIGIESRIAGLVSTKRALFSGLFDGTSDEVRFDGAASFLNQVERIVDPGPLPEVPTFAAEVADETEHDDALPAVRAEVGVEAARMVTELASPRAPSLARDGGASTAALFDALKVERTPEGGLKIEAPPEAAGALAALFAGMAKLLASAAAPWPR